MKFLLMKGAMQNIEELRMDSTNMLLQALDLVAENHASTHEAV